MNSKEHRGTTLARGIPVLISHSQGCPVPRAAKLKHQPPGLRVTPRVGQQDSLKGITAHRALSPTHCGVPGKSAGGRNPEEEPKAGKGKLKAPCRRRAWVKRAKRGEKEPVIQKIKTLAWPRSAPHHPIHPVFLLSSTSKNFS